MGEVETRTFIPDDEPGVPTDVRYERTRAIPFVETGAALGYVYSSGNFSFNAAIGHEMINWFGALDSRVFSDAYMEAQNIHQTSDISMDGEYVRIGVAYEY